MERDPDFDEDLEVDDESSDDYAGDDEMDKDDEEALDATWWDE